MRQTDPDVRIIAQKGKSFLFDKNLENIILNTKGIVHYSKTLEEKAFFSYEKKQHIAMIKGVDSNYVKVIPIDTYSGSWLNTNLRQAVLSNFIFDKMNLNVVNYGEPLNIYAPKAGLKYITNPQKAFEKIKSQVVGVFLEAQSRNQNLAFISLYQAQKLLNYPPNQISAIDIKTTKEDKESVLKSLQKKLESKYIVLSQEAINATFYKILNIEKLVAYLIFTLVIIIALFNIIGSMIMTIIEKKHNIKTLYNLGATLSCLKKIFIFQGTLLCVFGSIIGLALATILILLQKKFVLFYIAKYVPYPIEFRLQNFIIVFLTINILGLIASKIASRNITVTN